MGPTNGSDEWVRRMVFRFGWRFWNHFYWWFPGVNSAWLVRAAVSNFQLCFVSRSFRLNCAPFTSPFALGVSRPFVLWLSRLWSTRMTSSWRASWWSSPSTSRSGDSVGSCWLRSISAASRLRATTPIPRSMCAWRSAQPSKVPKTARGRRTPSVCRRHNVLSAWLHETRQRRNNGSAGLGGRWFEGLCSLMRIMSELPRRSSIQVFERKGPSYGSQFSSSVLVTLLRFDPVSDPSSGRPPLKFLFCLEVALPRGSWTFLFCRHIVPTIITWMAEKWTCPRLNSWFGAAAFHVGMGMSQNDWPHII